MNAPRETAWAKLLGLMAALALVLALGVPAYAQDKAAEGEPLPDPLGFRWMTISYNTAEGATDYLVMSGNGWLVNGEIAASGSYNHYSGAEGDDICVVPRELLGYGIWKTTGYGKVELTGTYGAFAGGTIVVEGKLKPKEVKDSQAVPALLTLNARIETGGITTVESEGALVQLSSGQTFAPVTTPSETCGFDIGGGQVEFVIYESRLSYLTPNDEKASGQRAGGAAAAAAGGTAAVEQQPSTSQGDRQSSSGGGNKSRQSNKGSVDKSDGKGGGQPTKSKDAGQETQNKGGGQAVDPNASPDPVGVTKGEDGQETQDQGGGGQVVGADDEEQDEEE